MTLYCATTNAGKLREFQHAADALAPQRFQFALLPGFGELTPPQEDGSTFEDNAVLKAVYYSRSTDQSVFADDSGLAVDALHGAPGVHSARFSGEGATDASNRRLLLERMSGVTDRRARFMCVIALARQGRLLGTFTGQVEGVILNEERGTDGFGYDPLFYYPAFGQTFGEASKERKLTVSHRGEAFRAMLGFLSTDASVRPEIGLIF